MLQGFRDFVLRGNTVDLTVGVVVGAALNNVVSSFTGSFLTPLIRLATGGLNAGVPTFDLGAFLAALLNFLLTALVLYLFVVQPTNRLNEYLKRVSKPPVAEPSNTEKLLAEIRDELRRPPVDTPGIAD